MYFLLFHHQLLLISLVLSPHSHFSRSKGGIGWGISPLFSSHYKPPSLLFSLEMGHGQESGGESPRSRANSFFIRMVILQGVKKGRERGWRGVTFLLHLHLKSLLLSSSDLSQRSGENTERVRNSESGLFLSLRKRESFSLIV